MPGGGKIGFLSALYRSSGGEQEAPEGSSAAGGSNVSEGSRRRWGRGPGRTRGGKTGGGYQGRTRRSRRERTPPDLTATAAAEMPAVAPPPLPTERSTWERAPVMVSYC